MDDARRLAADGLEAEPALAGLGGSSNEPAPPASEASAPPPPDAQQDHEVDHTVWDEPTLVAQSGDDAAPDGQLTYRRWLERGIAETRRSQTWLITLGVILAAGPFGILGAFMAAASGAGIALQGILTAVVLAPVTEEITKVAFALWIVEKRPFWFKSVFQILFCAAAGGLAFAAIENLMYLHLYVDEPTAEFRAWRWSICTALHVNCSMLTGWGLVRIWSKAIATKTRPELALGMPFFAIAMIAHGAYNFGVTIAEVFGWLDFD